MAPPAPAALKPRPPKAAIRCQTGTGTPPPAPSLRQLYPPMKPSTAPRSTTSSMASIMAAACPPAVPSAFLVWTAPTRSMPAPAPPIYTAAPTPTLLSGAPAMTASMSTAIRPRSRTPTPPATTRSTPPGWTPPCRKTSIRYTSTAAASPVPATTRLTAYLATASIRTR